LAKERDEKWLKREDVREGLYQPKYKVKKSGDDEKKPGGKCGGGEKISSNRLRQKTNAPSAFYLCRGRKPKKEKIEITGEGGFPLLACANFTDAKYVSKNPSNLPYNHSLPLNGQGCLPYNSTAHKFSAGFRNVRPYSMQGICPTEEILSCEIQINGISVGNIGRCSHATAEVCLPRLVIFLSPITSRSDTTPLLGAGMKASLSIYCTAHFRMTSLLTSKASLIRLDQKE
jgi:hypothetical protein